MHDGGDLTKSSTCSNTIKMPKHTTGCRIRSFMPIENMNVEELRATKINTNKFTEVRLKRIQKSAFPPCSLPPTLMFSFLK